MQDQAGDGLVFGLEPDPEAFGELVNRHPARHQRRAIWAFHDLWFIRIVGVKIPTIVPRKSMSLMMPSKPPPSS